MKYLEFYESCMKTGKLPKAGLCNCIPEDEMDIMHPGEDYSHPSYYYDWHWAYDGEFYNSWYSKTDVEKVSLSFSFTPLRQTIVLLLAAINGEL